MALIKKIKNLFKNPDYKDDLFIYDEVYALGGNHKNLFVVRLDGKVGVMNLLTQKEVIPCIHNFKDYGIHRYIPNCFFFSNRETETYSYYSTDNWKEIQLLKNKLVYYFFEHSGNIIVQQEQKFVVKDKANKILSNILYDRFVPIKSYAILVQAKGMWGVLDPLQGKEVIPCKYDEYKLLSDSVILVKSCGKWGVVNLKEIKEIIPCKYDEYKLLSDGVISVKSCGNWGVVDLEKIKETVPCNYEEVMCFADDMIPVKADGKWGFISKHTWNIAIPCTYSNIEPFNGEHAAIEQRKKWGTINKKNEKVLLSIYEKAIPIPGGLTIVWEEGRSGFRIINKEKITIYEGYKSYDPKLLEQDYLDVRAGGWQGKYGIISIKSGKLVVPCRYDFCYYNSSYGKDSVTIKVGEKEGWYSIALGRELVPCKYDDVTHSSGSVFKVTSGGKHGIYDAYTCREEISCKYSKYDPYGNHALVCLKDKWGLIARNTWDELLPCVFEDYRIKYNNSTIIAFKKNGKWGFFNDKGEQIETCHSRMTEKDRVVSVGKSDDSMQKEDKKKIVESKSNPVNSKTKKGKEEKAVVNKRSRKEKQVAPSFDVEKLISAVAVDGLLTEKEQSVILKKAKAAGYDMDEVRIMLEAKLYEYSQKGKKKVKTVNKVSTEKKVEKTKKEAKPKTTPKLKTSTKEKAEDKKLEVKSKPGKQKKVATSTSKQKKK